jgi:AcrR family transcriptional regulator
MTTMQTTQTTRAERQAVTRQQILAAAERLFAARGFGGTSLEDVASEAGYSKGAVYSNFAGKNDLFFAVIEDQFSDLADHLRRGVADATDLAGQFAAVVSWYDDFLQVESDWLRSLPDLMAVATQDPEARRRVADLLRSVEEAIAELLIHQQEVLGIRFALPPPTIAALAVSMVVGLTVRTVHELDPDDDRAGSQHFAAAMSVLLRPA